MRGLVTAGRGVRQERTACLGASVTGRWWLAAHSCVAGRSTRCCHRAWSTKQIGGGLFLEHGQGPAPAGQLAGDRDVGDYVALTTCPEGVPASVKAPVAGIATCSCRW